MILSKFLRKSEGVQINGSRERYPQGKNEDAKFY